MTAATHSSYLEAVGRRKTSVARVRIMTTGKNEMLVNGRSLEIYFPTETLRAAALEPLISLPDVKRPSLSIHVSGGGSHSQAGAVAHGLARVLTLLDQNFRTPLKRAGQLTRDSRMKERRKFGLKKARKAPQWSKR